MRGRPLNAVRTGLARFIDEAGPADKVAIETIADDSRWDADWGDSRDTAKMAISRLHVRGQRTRFWDGLLEGLHKLPSDPKARRILVISDGHDEGSTHQLEEVLNVARFGGTVVDAIGITRSEPAYLNGLRQLAGQTGGSFRQARTTSELEQLVASGIVFVNSMPVTTFVVSGVRADGQTHTFQVTWSHNGAHVSDQFTVQLPFSAPPASPDMRHWKFSLASAAAGLCILALLGVRLARHHRARRRTKAAADAIDGTSVGILQRFPSDSSPEDRDSSHQSSKVTIQPSQPGVAGSGKARPSTAPRAVRVQTQIATRFRKPTKELPSAWLVSESGTEAGRTVPVDECEFWIGALENNHLRIEADPAVSSNHACVVFDHDLLGIWDHHSTNGTRVNGEQLGITRRLLNPGDRIRIGTSTFLLKAEEGNR